MHTDVMKYSYFVTSWHNKEASSSLCPNLPLCSPSCWQRCGVGNLLAIFHDGGGGGRKGKQCGQFRVNRTCNSIIKQNNYNRIESHPSSSSSPSTSGIWTTTSTSVSLIKLCSLQFPRHKSAQVDSAERRLRTCERIRHPWPKTHLTSTELQHTVRQVFGQRPMKDKPGMLK
jgi:hypothetical protein